jgi:hypothetical protein
MNETLEVKVTFESKLNEFLAILKSVGIKNYQNKQSCCRSCAEFPNAKDKPFIWNFGGQGNAIEVTANLVFTRAGRRAVKRIYFYHQNLMPMDKTEIVLALHKAGLAYEWDGSDYKAIEVLVEESKP